MRVGILDDLVLPSTEVGSDIGWTCDTPRRHGRFAIDHLPQPLLVRQSLPEQVGPEAACLTLGAGKPVEDFDECPGRVSRARDQVQCDAIGLCLLAVLQLNVLY